ncbi:ATP-dependent DNA helicase RecG [Kineosphaera limosa NBRC 100340]|uniref:ATP-dependent DNA helicase RecG n=1 Tax=Kineosphaera limosa NBRC 100340 TaxID=1184609 RepID=K6WW06_9MICO|nr:ATP-dependent DNA helicase RecG [Kineosphaera limosa NBRC 100340]
MVTLQTPLSSRLLGSYAQPLQQQRGLQTVEDLLWFLPRRYLDGQEELTEFTEGEYVVLEGTVRTVAKRPMSGRRRSMLNVLISTAVGDLEVTFFSVYGHQDRLIPGAKGLFEGRVGRYGSRWQLSHPSYEMLSDLDDDAPTPDAGHGLRDQGGTPGLGVVARALHPVYLEVRGVPSWTINRLVATVLGAMSDDGDPLPAELRRRRDLPGYVAAMRHLHLPEHRDDVAKGKKRLKYDEALLMQLALGMRRRAQQQAPAVPRAPRQGGLLEAFDKRLPFTLTAGQRAVGEEIAADLARSHPMNRLLQGEVGSGKTVVALRAMLAVIDAGGQAALLAPTEVLAAQHYRTITTLLGDLAQGGMLGGDLDRGTRVALLTGSQSAAARKQALLAAASGEAGIVVGTHALIQKHVQLADLGLVVVDEQHRFGVEQRDALREKAKKPPHVLVMTATPIPRTVAMTVFGDMDTSVLAELPAGRQPIGSFVVGNRLWYERTWGRVADEVRAGRQVYVVCPRIGEEWEERSAVPTGAEALNSERAWLTMTDAMYYGDDDPERDEGVPLRGVHEVARELRELPALRDVRVGILHGRLTPDEKDRAMAAFTAGEIDVLVSTTVVEVGVDVPNATLMVVTNSDRFGISQLHQLRGRVGRGEHPGLCLFVLSGVPDIDHPGTPGLRPGDPNDQRRSPAVERMTAIAATNDGFELSQLDLQYRREGDILGARQSGGTSLRMLSLRGGDDAQIIEAAREDAAALLDQDPTLAGQPHLSYLVNMVVDEQQAAFLERG